MPSAIYRALGKAFAECHVSTRQRKVDLTETARLTSPLPSGDVSGARQNIFLFFSKKFFAECHGVGTRQCAQFCRVLWTRHSAKCPVLLSALDEALGKVPSFAECHDHSTRQIWDLSRFCPVFCFPSLQTNKSHIHNHHMPRITIYIT